MSEDSNQLEPWQKFQKEYGIGPYHNQPQSGPSFYTDQSGHEVWSTNTEPDGYSNFPVHMLVAILAGEDPHHVFAEGTEVHHDNGVPWDNRPENVVVLGKSEHASIHAKERIARGTFPIPGKEDGE